MSEFDSPWKEALEWFLRQFLEFFFPDVFRGIDWSRSYESLDKELQQIVREGELGRRLADKLFKVWRRDGEEAWVLIHVEVQNQAEEHFGERMYVYHYRIFDRFRRPVVSLGQEPVRPGAERGGNSTVVSADRLVVGIASRVRGGIPGTDSTI